MDSNHDFTATIPDSKQFEFTGKAGEFFSIWIVNVCLTILTLGIYSAWAKVRTQQYFYGNTKLDDISFRYLADPRQILKGRIIAFVFFLAYYFSGLISPLAAGVTFLILMLLMPALMVMSMSFRLRNSSYRNVIFNFEKNYKKAYMIFAIPVVLIGAYIFAISMMQPGQAVSPDSPPEFPILLAILPLIIMLMFPWWEFLITRFRVNHAKFGNADFIFDAGSKDYYKMYFIAFLVFFFFGMVIAFITAGIMSNKFDKEEVSSGAIGVQLVMFALVLPLYLWMFAYIQTRRTNLIYNNININRHQLRSDLKVGYMMYLYVTNTLAMAFSLGLLMPWAKIRTARYRASRTSLIPVGSLGEFVNTQQQKQSALGEEVGEMFDMDLGI